MKPLPCIALIVAGGSGRRVGGNLPKQYQKISEKPILAYSMQAFESCPAIDEIHLVAHEDYRELIINMVKKYKINKFCKIYPAGNTRQESVSAGIQNLPDESFILIHDAARPFIKAIDIECVINEVKIHKTAILANYVSDTIKVADDNCNIIQTPNRKNLYAAQTPQGFYGEIIKKAHEKAKINGIFASDDAALVECDFPVKIIIESKPELNFKITTQFDLLFAEFLTTQIEDDVP
ncbi:MAG: 2-C-methyl-D-erythritol 4-phosphate cytidylyltransferase [Defluviitaleaceae bacterium]|nr:2-C-methyl-D-erythritol 4-phosphate cytidylyltransferase [Defluviitaleaceae bacterium]